MKNEYNTTPEPEKLVEEIFAKYSVDEFVEIAMMLLSHEMVDEPPEIVEKYAEMIVTRETLNFGTLDMTDKQAWIMARDDYFEEVVDCG